MNTAPPPARTPRLRGLLAVLALMMSVVLGTATAAQAHVGLRSSNPSEGSTVTGPLPAVDLTFTGRVLPREVTVTGPAGASAATAAATASGVVITQPVALTDAGTYTVAYAITSSDGHPVEGSLTFTYAPPAPLAPSSEAPASTSPPSVAPASLAPAEPSEAATTSAAQSSTGVPGWALAAGAVIVLVAAAVLLTVRRRRVRR